MGPRFPMAAFTDSFERCAKACQKRDDELGLDPDAIEIVGLPEDIMNHRKTLERDTTCGLITDREYRHYVETLMSINNIGSVTALVICCTIFTPGIILSLDYSHSTFASFWRSRIVPILTEQLAHEAQDIVTSTDLLTLLIAAQAEVEAPTQDKERLNIPKQPHVSRRKSVSRFVCKTGLVRKLRLALKQ